MDTERSYHCRTWRRRRWRQSTIEVKQKQEDERLSFLSARSIWSAMRVFKDLLSQNFDVRLPLVFCLRWKEFLRCSDRQSGQRDAKPNRLSSNSFPKRIHWSAQFNSTPMEAKDERTPRIGWTCVFVYPLLTSICTEEISNVSQFLFNEENPHHHRWTTDRKTKLERRRESQIYFLFLWIKTCRMIVDHRQQGYADMGMEEEQKSILFSSRILWWIVHGSMLSSFLNKSFEKRIRVVSMIKWAAPQVQDVFHSFSFLIDFIWKT